MFSAAYAARRFVSVVLKSTAGDMNGNMPERTRLSSLKLLPRPVHHRQKCLNPHGRVFIAGICALKMHSAKYMLAQTGGDICSSSSARRRRREGPTQMLSGVFLRQGLESQFPEALSSDRRQLLPLQTRCLFPNLEGA